MKRTLTTIILSICILMTAGCGAEKEYYPLEELNSTGVSENNLGFFKADLKNSGLFNSDQFAFKVGFRNGNCYVTLFELDETGKEINSCVVGGDFKADVATAAFQASSWEYEFYEYDFILDDEGVLIGTRRHLDKETLNTDAGVKKIKAQLVDAGYPYFDFKVEKDTVYYGQYLFEGPAANVIIGTANGVPGWASDYSFSDSKGVIISTEINLG